MIRTILIQVKINLELNFGSLIIAALFGVLADSFKIETGRLVVGLSGAARMQISNLSKGDVK